MKSALQQVVEDVLVGSRQAPPPKLEVSSRRNGLLKDLVVLGDVPVTEAVIGSVGLVYQDRRHQLSIRVSLSKPEDTLVGYLVRVWVRCSRLEHHPIARWSGNILPPGSHVVAAGRTDSSLAEAVHPSVGPCQGHSSLDAPSELNLPQRIPSPLSIALLVPQAEG